MAVNYTPIDPVAGQPRTDEVSRWTDYGDTIADINTRITAYEADTTASDHIADAADAHDASAISIVDAGAYFTATDVEAALQELGAGGGGGGSTVNLTGDQTVAGIKTWSDAQIFDATDGVQFGTDLVLVRRSGAAAQRVALSGKAASNTNPFLEINPVPGAVTGDPTIAGFQLYRLGNGDEANREFFYLESRGDSDGEDFTLGSFASGTGEVRRVLFRYGHQSDANHESFRMESDGSFRFAKAVHGLTSLYLDGTAGNYVVTPDTAALDITGDIDLRAEVALDDWTSTEQALISKYTPTGDQRSYLLRVMATTGELNLIWSEAGTATVKQATSTVAPTATDGQPLWVRATLDVNNGSGGHTVTFYTSPDGIDWTQLGTPVTTAGTTSIFAGTSTLRVGARGDDLTPLIGRVFRAQVYNGINGTLAAQLVCDGGAVDPRFRDRTGKVWTFTGSAWSWMSGRRTNV